MKPDQTKEELPADLACHLAEFADTVEQIRCLVDYRRQLEVTILKLCGWQRDARPTQEDMWYRQGVDLQDAGRWSQSSAIDVCLSEVVYSKPKVGITSKDVAECTIRYPEPEGPVQVAGAPQPVYVQRSAVKTNHARYAELVAKLAPGNVLSGRHRRELQEEMRDLERLMDERIMDEIPLDRNFADAKLAAEALDRKVKWVLEQLSTVPDEGQSHSGVKVRDPILARKLEFELRNRVPKTKFLKSEHARLEDIKKRLNQTQNGPSALERDMLVEEMVGLGGP